MAIKFTVEMIVGLPCLVLGFLMFAVAFGSPQWFTTGTSLDDHQGLWKACLADTCANYDTVTRPDWLVGIEALECLAMLLILFSISATIILAVRPHKVISLLVSMAAIGGGVLGALGAAVFCAEMAITGLFTQWAFYLNLVGDVTVGLGGVAMFVNTIHRWIRTSNSGGAQQHHFATTSPPSGIVNPGISF